MKIWDSVYICHRIPIWKHYIALSLQKLSLLVLSRKGAAWSSGVELCFAIYSSLVILAVEVHICKLLYKTLSVSSGFVCNFDWKRWVLYKTCKKQYFSILCYSLIVCLHLKILRIQLYQEFNFFCNLSIEFFFLLFML